MNIAELEKLRVPELLSPIPETPIYWKEESYKDVFFLEKKQNSNIPSQFAPMPTVSAFEEVENLTSEGKKILFLEDDLHISDSDEETSESKELEQLQVFQERLDKIFARMEHLLNKESKQYKADVIKKQKLSNYLYVPIMFVK